MTISTKITSGTSGRSSSAFSIAAGSSVIVFTSANLANNEYIIAERSQDGGSTWRPLGNAVLVDQNVKEARITGPVTDCRLTISDTAAATIVYTDE